MCVLLVAAIFFFPFAAPGQTGKNEGQTQNNKTQSKRVTQKTRPESPVTQEIPKPTAQPEPKPKEQAAKQEPKSWLTRDQWVMAILPGIYVFLTGVYVLIALHTLKAINRQAKLTEQQGESNAQKFERQLKAMQNQLAVMESQLSLAARQWIDLREWTAVQKVGKSGAEELTVGFEIFNPTRLPLILEMVETKIKGLDLPFVFEQRVSLMPDGHHRLWVNFDLTEEMKIEFRAINGLMLRTHITVWFSDELKRGEEQHFSGQLLYTKVAGKESGVFLPEGNMIARPSGQNHDETAN
jgi:hypothetical protein